MTDEDWSQYLTLSLLLRWAKNTWQKDNDMTIFTSYPVSTLTSTPVSFIQVNYIIAQVIKTKEFKDMICNYTTQNLIGITFLMQHKSLTNDLIESKIKT